MSESHKLNIVHRFPVILRTILKKVPRLCYKRVYCATMNKNNKFGLWADTVPSGIFWKCRLHTILACN